MAAASEVVSVLGNIQEFQVYPLDMRYINDKQNSRPPRANESSFIPCIQAARAHLASDSPQASPKAINTGTKA